MGAISKAWLTQADAAVDPDSPVDATLMTGFRDNLIHLREWVGFSFFAGAVQDHNHDGVNTALVPIGPNLIRNASFEQGTSGWTITTYSGGSSAVETANDAHGAQSLSFTSTVLANGGGDALSNEFVPCGGSVDLRFEAWRKASVINVASKAQVIWYSDAKAQVSVASVYTDTNTPTTATRARVGLTSPATARWFKLRLTGGTPGAGSATGTIYFDGVNASDWTIIQGYIEAGAVGQAELKTATGDMTATMPSSLQTGPGGEYGFWPTVSRSTSLSTPQLLAPVSPVDCDALAVSVIVGTSLLQRFHLGETGSGTLTVRERYVQASPPYDLGDGEVPLFVFALVDSLGNVLATYVAPDPPWANNGPTIIRPDLTIDGRPYRRRRAMTHTWAEARDDRAKRAIFAEELASAPLDLVEITQAVKQADMPLIPHPFGGDLTGKTVVLVDPVSAMAERLLRFHEGFHDSPESLCGLLHDGYVRLGNVPLPRARPPGVMAVTANWKLT